MADLYIGCQFSTLSRVSAGPLFFPSVPSAPRSVKCASFLNIVLISPSKTNSICQATFSLFVYSKSYNFAHLEIELISAPADSMNSLTFPILRSYLGIKHL